MNKNQNQNLIIKSLLGGGKLEDENKILLEEINKIKKQFEEQTKEIQKLKDENANLIQEIQLEAKPKKQSKIEDYDFTNIKKFLRTKDEILLPENNHIYLYDENETAFDRIEEEKQKTLKFSLNSKGEKVVEKVNLKLQDYQTNFIKDWSLSTQKNVILYYGVGLGKTIIAVNCAEQFAVLNNNEKQVFFITPSSLVLGTIKEMFYRGIDPTRKNSKGQYIYNFVSYQQLLRSKFDFTDDCLIIIDEVHNLRNIRTEEIFEKVSSRKKEQTGTYSLVGNKLSQRLITTKATFSRCLFMTGTLFVNSSQDIEAIISIGEQSAPLINFSFAKYQNMIYDDEAFKNRYNGLIAYKTLSDNDPRFPTKKYIVDFVRGEPEPIHDEEYDPFSYSGRNEFNNLKIKWILKFIKERPKERTIIYAQFLTLHAQNILEQLKKKGVKVGFITGQQSAVQKMEVVRQYNTGELNVLVFTLAIKEGISFKETNNIIFDDPYWNYAIMEQIIARGIRLDSHSKGSKSVIDIHLLIGVNKDGNKTLLDELKKGIEDVFNNNIKTYTKEKEIIFVESVKQAGTDIKIYQKVLNKQLEINNFWFRMNKICDSFEKANTIDNNEFVLNFNNEILEREKEKNISNLEKNKIKKEMYKDFYLKNINKIKQQNLRDFSKMKEFRNPDLEDINTNLVKIDNIEKVKEFIKKGTPLSEIFNNFNISKTIITTFQANFTPEEQVNKLIKLSGIEEDKNPLLYVLEPTAGIGNMLGGLITLPNIQNMLISSNEIFNLFYEIGKEKYKDINNIFWTNIDFLNYQSRFSFDYIIGNPPFNLATQANVLNRYGKLEIDEKTKKPIKGDVRLYDINFVSMCFNMLKVGGKIAFIISDRFLRDTKQPFKKFNQYMEYYKNINHLHIEKVEEFKTTNKEKTTKEQETAFGMVYIIITKKSMQDFIIFNGLEVDSKTGKDIEKGGQIEDLSDELGNQIKKPKAKKRTKRKKRTKSKKRN